MSCCCIDFRSKSVLGYCVCGLSLTVNEKRVISRLVLKLSFMYGFVAEKHVPVVRYLLELYGEKLVTRDEDLSTCRNHAQCRSYGGFCICFYSQQPLSADSVMVVQEFVKLLKETSCNENDRTKKNISLFIERHKNQLYGELPVFDECRHHSPCFRVRFFFQNN